MVPFPLSPTSGSNLKNQRRWVFRLLCRASLLVLLVGCSHEESIQRYKAPRLAEREESEGELARRPAAPTPRPPKPSPPKPSPPMPSAPPEAVDGPRRTLGAIVPLEGQAWFFRVTADHERLVAKRDAWGQFIASLQFDGDRPQWQLPEGWQQQPGSGMRFATILMDAEDPSLELSVIPLPMPVDGDVGAYVLANVNRWRGQLSLPPLDAEQLAREAETVALPGSEITLVDFGESP